MTRTPARGGGFALPPLDPRIRNVLGGLFGLWVLELVASAAGAPLYGLVWASGRALSAPWTLLTCYLVQGPNVLQVLLNLLVLYFFLPTTLDLLPRRQLGEAAGAVLAGATLLPLLWDLTIGGTGAVNGWGVFLLPMVCLFGLAHPDATVALNFVLPVRAVWFVWGSLALVVLELLAALGNPGAGTLGAVHRLGAWVAIYGWWQLRGPGARYRPSSGRKRTVARDARRFEVFDGQRGRDDVWHCS